MHTMMYTPVCAVEVSGQVTDSVKFMMGLIINISKDEDHSETNLSNALGLLG